MKNKILILFVFFGTIAQGQPLDSLLLWAANNHPGLKAAYLSYEASLQNVHGSGFLPDPTFSFGYFISTPETRVGPQLASLGLQQLFPWKGTLNAHKNLAVAQSKLQFESFNLLKIKLYQQVKELYFVSENKEAKLKLLRENISLLEQVKSIGLSKITVGYGSTTDILRLNLKINDLKSTASTVKIEQGGLIKQLELLTGRGGIKPDFEENFIQEQFISLDSVVHHPMLEIALQKLAMNEAQKKLIAQQGLPKLGVGLNYIIVGNRTDANPVDNGKDIFMPKLTFSLPIHRKKYRALRRMNQLENESMQYEEKAVQLDLNKKYVLVVAAIESAQERIVLYQQQVKVSESIVGILLSDYENGQASIEQIFDTQAELIHFQIQLEQAIKDLKVASSQLAFLLNKEI